MRRLLCTCVVVLMAAMAPLALAQPANDDCAAATPVGEGSFAFDNIGALLDGPTDCDGNMTTDVWFLYTASAAGLAIIDTCATVGTLDDTTLIVYDGAVCPVTGDPFIACDDDSCGPAGFNSTVSVPVAAGDQLLIQVGGWNGSEGDGTLTIALGAAEDCTNGIDDDLDGAIDCADSDCFADPACIEDGAECSDGIDNDGDGLTDCDDFDCAADPACIEDGAECSDGVDNDGDGAIDCADTDCFADPACIPANDDCANATPVNEGIFAYQNTGALLDGPTDCDANMSTDVWFQYTATVTGDVVVSTCDTVAGPGALTDTTLIVYAGTVCPIAGDPFLACDDDTCAPIGGGFAFLSSVTLAVTAGDQFLVQVGGWNGTQGLGTLSIAPAEICNDGIDNDLDGNVDCDDTDCSADPSCPENCTDGIDNDADGAIDCNDSECVGDPACIESNCTDGLDDDGDGLIDCDDSDCNGDPACAPVNDLCVNATPVSEGSFAFDNIGSVLDGPNDCDGNMTTDVWFLYTASAAGVAVIDTCATVGTLDDTTLIVYDGATCPVAGDPFIACDDDSCGPIGFNSAVSVPVAAGDQILVQVGGWNGSTGDGTLTIGLGAAEDCANGIDDDLDGAIDCADADCAADPVCIEDGAECSDGLDNDGDGLTDCDDPDCNGDPACAPANDLCVNATPVGEGSFAFDNTGSALDGPTDCDGNMTTDVWFLYTASAAGLAIIDTCATVGTLDDTTLIVYDGATCPVAGDPFIACDDDSCGPAGFNSTVSIPVAAGDQLLVQVGGWNGSTGDGTLTIGLGALEDCTNGIDDDLDGLTDCDDPDCVADPACNEEGEVECGDGLDNDGDGLVDCDDPGCDGTLVCAPVYSGETHVIVDQDAIEGDVGAVASGAALEAALLNNGQSVVRYSETVTSVASILADPGVQVIWVVQGTFPADDRLTGPELETLFMAQQAGKGVYLHGGDHWGFLPVASSFDTVDGVLSAADGGDLVTALDGFNTALGDYSDLVDLVYTQDVPAGNDWTDELQTATSADDAGITDAARFFGPDDALALADFGVVIGAQAAAGGNVISSSVEFGGMGDATVQDDLVCRFAAFLGAPCGPVGTQFVRGDANDDGLVNIADVIFIANYLFVMGSAVPHCLDSANVNNDPAGVNIADAVYLANFLFVGGSPPPPAPFPGCGIATPISGCAFFNNCP